MITFHGIGTGSPVGMVARDKARLQSMGKPVGCRVGKNSARQESPAFGTAAFQDKAAGAGRHASPESMSAFAFDAARLICTFHGKSKSYLKTRRWAEKSDGEGYVPAADLSIVIRLWITSTDEYRLSLSSSTQL